MTNAELAEKITDMLFTTKGPEPTAGKNLQLRTDTFANNGEYLAGLSKEAAVLYIKKVLDDHNTFNSERCAYQPSV